MRKNTVRSLVVVLALWGLLPALAQAQKNKEIMKEIIQLQTTVDHTQQQVRELQRGLVERTTVLTTLVEQAVDSVNRMSTTVASLERAVREGQANAEARVGSLGTEVQALRDSLDEMGVRVAKLSEQLAETRGVLQSLDARLTQTPTTATPGPAAPTQQVGPATPTQHEGTPPTSGGTPPPVSTPSASPPPPSAETLYATALRDLTTGKYDLARQQFADYLKYYGDTALAGNAQFYIGETYYQEKDYRQAVSEYDRVLTSYPTSYKMAAAQLKKGLALLELNDREAGIRALRGVIRRYPKSEEAQRAREHLQRLGVTTSGSQ